MIEPDYLIIARKYIGVAEIKGIENSSVIMGWRKKLHSWFNNDEIPWCGDFMAVCMLESGYSYPKAHYRALAWAEWGKSIGFPVLPPVGTIAVLGRKGGGHVGIVTGVNVSGSHVRLLGGNQSDKVCEAWFDIGRVIAYRQPSGVFYSEKVIAKVGELSKSEA